LRKSIIVYADKVFNVGERQCFKLSNDAALYVIFTFTQLLGALRQVLLNVWSFEQSVCFDASRSWTVSRKYCRLRTIAGLQILISEEFMLPKKTNTPLRNLSLLCHGSSVHTRAVARPSGLFLHKISNVFRNLWET